MLSQNGILVSGHANARYRDVSTCRAKDKGRLHPTFLAGTQYSGEMRGEFVDHGNLRRCKNRRAIGGGSNPFLLFRAKKLLPSAAGEMISGRARALQSRPCPRGLRRRDRSRVLINLLVDQRVHLCFLARRALQYGRDFGNQFDHLFGGGVVVHALRSPLRLRPTDRQCHPAGETSAVFAASSSSTASALT